ncbi:UNVERIFIED_CONTAM: hypothetical protein PYX00_000403 [Menopon gallinae]|uniref:Uncharacterized protein n=1 Tax=Menopon gallinae TaxID=328185 RepID=A0AAW2IA06_9NEOP
MKIGLFFIALIHYVHGLNRMEVVYQWKSIDFEYPDRRSREESIAKGEFVPGNAVPLDVDVWNNGVSKKIFVTFPKFKDGIPVALATVSPNGNGEGHLLKPYPDWSWQAQSNRDCDKLTSVFRTQIDKCGRIWAIDSGMVNLSASGRRQCQPQLVVFNLQNDKLSGRHKFSDSLLKEESILANLAVDLRSDNCQDAFAYIADVTSYALIVFDAKNDKAWQVKSNTMYPYPPYGVFRANNAEFDLMDGILGMALAPASVRESWVPVSALRNERNFDQGENKIPRQFQTSDEARKSQSIAEAFDKNGILYFGMMDDNSINCWNSDTAYKSSNIHQLEQDNLNLQFSSGLKIIPNEKDEEEIWVMTDRFQLLMTGDMKKNEVNFRIVRGKLDDLLRNSPCRKYKPIVFPNKTEPCTEKYTKPPQSHYG